MIVVFDKSASMAGLKLALAKEATKAALQSLREMDNFGIVAFDYNAYSPVTLQPKNINTMTAAIDRIVASGETNAYPALEQAFVQLSASKSDIKHVILLSDGRSIAKDFETLIKKMAAARITVSSVAVGNEADRDLLEKLQCGDRDDHISREIHPKCRKCLLTKRNSRQDRLFVRTLSRPR